MPLQFKRDSPNETFIYNDLDYFLGTVYIENGKPHFDGDGADLVTLEELEEILKFMKEWHQ